MIEKKYHIFVSYSRTNKDIKDQIVKDLIDYGFDVWVDTENINLTKNWTDEIKTGIASSKILLYLGSPEAKESTYVSYELGYADALDKIIFPIRIKGHSWGDSSPDWYSLVQGMEIRGSQYAKRKSKLFTSICEVLLNHSSQAFLSKQLVRRDVRRQLSSIIKMLANKGFDLENGFGTGTNTKLNITGVNTDSNHKLLEFTEILKEWGLIHISPVDEGQTKFKNQKYYFFPTRIGHTIIEHKL